MPQRRSNRRSHSEAVKEQSSPRVNREMTKTLRENVSRGNPDSRVDQQSRASLPSLTNLIERDAPLQAHSVLVLMYGPFQAEMVPEEGQGVASWLRECVRKHGIPSLLRFDYRRRAQVFRRDQFQPWLDPLLTEVTS